jgi:hypothetical protein
MHGTVSFMYGAPFYPNPAKPEVDPFYFRKDPARGTGRTSRMLLKALQSLLHPNVRLVVVVVQTEEFGKTVLDRLNALAKALAIEPVRGRTLLVMSAKEWERRRHYYAHGVNGTRVYIDHAALR